MPESSHRDSMRRRFRDRPGYPHGRPPKAVADPQGRTPRTGSAGCAGERNAGAGGLVVGFSQLLARCRERWLLSRQRAVSRGRAGNGSSRHRPPDLPRTCPARHHIRGQGSGSRRAAQRDRHGHPRPGKHTRHDLARGRPTPRTSVIDPQGRQPHLSRQIREVEEEAPEPDKSPTPQQEKTKPGYNSRGVSEGSTPRKNNKQSNRRSKQSQIVCGAEGIRTPDPHTASVMRYQTAPQPHIKFSCPYCTGRTLIMLFSRLSAASASVQVPCQLLSARPASATRPPTVGSGLSALIRRCAPARRCRPYQAPGRPW